jgi:hypothetical protein
MPTNYTIPSMNLKAMKTKLLLLQICVPAFITPATTLAQSTIAAWTFDGVEAGETTSIAPDFVDLRASASELNESGGVNNIGVVNAAYGQVRVEGSSPLMAPAYEVGMSTPGPDLSESGYSLSFSISPAAGNSFAFVSLSFDFGYDTNYATSQPNYFAPRAQLFVSTDGSNWTAASGELTPDIGGDESIFSTGAGSGGAHFVESRISVDLTTALPGAYGEGDTVHFRIALADDSGADRRRHVIDSICVFGDLPGVSWWAGIPDRGMGIRNTAGAFGAEPGLGWIYDSGWPELYFFGIHSGNWAHVVVEGGVPQAFHAYLHDTGHWIWANSALGWYYNFSTESWVPF